jgi:hypothetical protein
MSTSTPPLLLTPEAILGELRRLPGAPPFQGAVGYQADAVGQGVAYSFAPGALRSAGYVSADWLLEGNQLAVFVISLREG